MPIYPFHRRDAAHQKPPTDTPTDPPETECLLKVLARFLIHWAKISWADVLGMILLSIASNLIYKAPLAPTRNFPITFDQSGDIVYPEFAYPDRGWVISPRVSGLIATLVPTGVIVLAQIRIRSIWDMNNAIMGVLYATILGTLFQVVIKKLIGGFRPYFLEVCQPDINRASTHNTTGLNGVGFKKIMYTVEVCTNPDKQALQNAMTSFPSGHANVAFAGFVFLFLWMNAKLKVWANYRTSFWWLALLFAPLLLAVLQACILSIDQAHNWYNILVGAMIGTLMAFASYRVMYASVFDWRYNHIPLKRTKTFDYTPEFGQEYMEREVFVKKLGWGMRRRNGRRGLGSCGRGTPGGPRITSTMPTYNRQEDRVDDVASGETEQPRGRRPEEWAERSSVDAVQGDHMV